MGEGEYGYCGLRQVENERYSKTVKKK